MNKLFPIPLEGQGTPDVESLSSYIYRSAYEHGVSVGQFMRYILLVDNATKVKGGYKSITSYIRPDTLIRPNKISMDVANVLGEFTGNKFTEGVLRFLSRNIGTCNLDVVKGFRWCPECIKEMEELGGSIYFKLIWHLSGFEACHAHRTPLVNECQFCGDKQTGIKRNQPFGMCRNCGMPLSQRKNSLGPHDINDSNLMAGVDIDQLIKNIYQYPDIELDMRLARNSLSFVMNCKPPYFSDTLN